MEAGSPAPSTVPHRGADPSAALGQDGLSRSGHFCNVLRVRFPNTHSLCSFELVHDEQRVNENHVLPALLVSWAVFHVCEQWRNGTCSCFRSFKSILNFFLKKGKKPYRTEIRQLQNLTPFFFYLIHFIYLTMLSGYMGANSYETIDPRTTLKRPRVNLENVSDQLGAGVSNRFMGT